MFSFFKKKQSTPAPTAVVLPRIKHLNFLSAIENMPEMADQPKPIAEPLAGDLLLTYAVDIGPYYVSLTSQNLQEYGLSISDLQAMAIANALPTMKNIESRTNGTLYQLSAEDNLTACSILYPELWQHLQQEVGGPVVVVFPHRDCTFYAADNPQGIAALKEVIDSIDFDDTHALSKQLYRLTSNGWQAEEF